MKTFTSNIPMIINNSTIMKDVSAQTIDISQNLFVGGSSTFLESVDLCGQVTIDNNLDVYGSVFIENNLEVSGNVVIYGTLDISAGPFINLGISGDLVIDGTLDISGDVTIKGNLNVQNSTYTYDKTTINSIHLDICDNIIKINVKENQDLLFDTIVIRRPNGKTGGNNYAISLAEIQIWVNGNNILVNNSTDLSGYFILWPDFQTNVGFNTSFSDVPSIYNGVIDQTDADDIATINEDYNADPNGAIIIKNIPKTYIYNIQSIVYYNRGGAINNVARAIGLAIELYNMDDDSSLLSPLVSTNEISKRNGQYRFDFPAISTYPDASFSTSESTSNIISDAIIEVITDLPEVITGNSLTSGIMIQDVCTNIFFGYSGLEETQEHSDKFIITKTNYDETSDTSITYDKSVDVFINGSLDVSGTINVFDPVGSNGFVPLGSIIMWSGSSVPSGWALCDGTNGTPNLKGKFIVGMDASMTEFDAIDNSGGSLIISSDNLPTHSHSGTTDISGSHSHSGTTDDDGSHSHTLGIIKASNTLTTYSTTFGSIKTLNANAGNDYETSLDGLHSHTFTTDVSGDHAHTFTTDTCGNSSPYYPPYYVLSYIMCID